VSTFLLTSTAIGVEWRLIEDADSNWEITMKLTEKANLYLTSSPTRRRKLTLTLVDLADILLWHAQAVGYREGLEEGYKQGYNAAGYDGHRIRPGSY
jgi:hypothetical protein